MDKTIVEITSKLELLGFLKANGTDCRFVGITTETPVTNIRVACPFKGVLKVSKKLGWINQNYVAGVERRIAAALGKPEKDIWYVPGETWYKHLETVDGKPLPVVVHKTKDDGEYYLQYFPKSSVNAYVMPGGDPVTKEQLEPWFHQSSKNEFKPAVISVKLSNIKRIAASGIIMQAEDLDEAEQILATVQ